MHAAVTSIPKLLDIGAGLMDYTDEIHHTRAVFRVLASKAHAKNSCLQIYKLQEIDMRLPAVIPSAHLHTWS